MDVKLFRLYFSTSFGTLPRYTGGMARGMFFNALKDHDHHLATEVHDREGIKRFSLSGFRKVKNGGGKSGDETLSTLRKALGLGPYRREIRNEDGDVLYLDVVTADPELAKVMPIISSQVWRGPKNGLELKPLKLIPIDFKSVMQVELPNPFTVYFFSPLSFSSGPKHYPWPEPRYILQNLSSIWNAWFPEDRIEGEEILENHGHKVDVDYAKGSVVSASTAKGMTHKGWVGTVRFKSKGEDTHMIFSLLMKLGFFTGIGRGRTAGLGRYFFPGNLHPDDLDKLS